MSPAVARWQRPEKADSVLPDSMSPIDQTGWEWARNTRPWYREYRSSTPGRCGNRVNSTSPWVGTRDMANSLPARRRRSAGQALDGTACG